MKTSDMEESKLVLDLSVLIKWFALEVDDLEAARSIESDFLAGIYKILMPVFYTWELNNYLSRNFDSHTATSIYSHFKSYKFQYYDLNLKITKLAFEIIEKSSKISFYDASYHALAICENATFVTSDKTYFEKTKKLGHIKLLSDFNS